MRWIWAACLSFGLAACEDPQPDVSAHTILNLIVQTEGDPEVLPLTLGALYEHVEVVAQSADSMGTSILLTMGRDDRPDIAHLRCETLFAPLGDLSGVDAALSAKIQQALAAPLADANRRVWCQFTYDDRIERAQNFLTQAKMWSASHVGEVTPDAEAGSPETAFATAPARALSLHQTTSGTASVIFLIDLP